jgi:hypothetical protein
MGQHFRPWRSGVDERAWLSRLVETMEKLSREKSAQKSMRRDFTDRPCDPAILIAVRAQLGRKVSSQGRYPTRFSLPN